MIAYGRGGSEISIVSMASAFATGLLGLTRHTLVAAIPNHPAKEGCFRDIV